MKTQLNTHNNNNMLTVNQYHLWTEKMFSPNKTVVSNTLRICNASPHKASEKILILTPQDLAVLAKDATGSKQVDYFLYLFLFRYLQEHLESNEELRKKILETVLFNEAELFEQLSKDHFANFKLISSLKQGNMTNQLYEAIEDYGLDLSFHRFACRVVQEFVRCSSSYRAQRLLSTFDGYEAEIACDQNANHILQRILDRHNPDVYANFFKNLITNAGGVAPIIQNKYGCRVVQMCFEKTVEYCKKRDIEENDKK